LILNQGSFPPSALPGFIGTTSLSDTLQRPDRPSRASGWSSPTTPRGFPCCVCRPCVHAIATTPAQRRAALLCSIRSVVSAFPERVVGSACASTFSRFAQRSLALRPAHSRCHRILWHASPKASAASLPPPLLRLLPAGALRRAGIAPAGTTSPFHGARHNRSFKELLDVLFSRSQVCCRKLASTSITNPDTSPRRQKPKRQGKPGVCAGSTSENLGNTDTSQSKLL
jgi:hypothetical protein